MGVFSIFNLMLRRLFCNERGKGVVEFYGGIHAERKKCMKKAEEILSRTAATYRETVTRVEKCVLLFRSV